MISSAEYQIVSAGLAGHNKVCMPRLQLYPLFLLSDSPSRASSSMIMSASFAGHKELSIEP
jgi:hypothetical protein